MLNRWILAVALASWLGLFAPAAFAHCDGEDGPVARAAQRALDTGNVNIALPYAPPEAEAEIVARFEQARRVRTRGRDARALAGRAFTETVVRLHRVGEGASYTGLRPAGMDYGPMVPAAEAALETQDLSRVRQIVLEQIDHGLRERLEHAREARAATLEPRNHDGVAAARERVRAELEFITYAETLRQAIEHAATAHHED